MSPIVKDGLLEKVRDPVREKPFLEMLCEKSAWTAEGLWEWLEDNEVSLFRASREDWLGVVSPNVRALFVKGEVGALFTESIAVVGTRRASRWGTAAAFRFAKGIADCGVNVVSGLARGIDTAAHRGALFSRGGKTVAVLGSGLDRIYPRENFDLAEKIVAAGGCLVSEYLPDTPPLPHHFPLRNRLVAGISDSVFVVEAPEKSGAKITAWWALELGRDVQCLAAPYDDVSFRGNLRLVQEGAKLVCEVADLFSVDFRERPSGANTRREISEIAALFQENRAYSLAELLDLKGGDIANLTSELRKLVESGSLVEIEPLHFLKTE
jgi:DNA processing protein